VVAPTSSVKLATRAVLGWVTLVVPTLGMLPAPVLMPVSLLEPARKADAPAVARVPVMPALSLG
jgi:hypothetical protein